jgi:UDP-N-acetylglucosamine 2-epimerase (non-hydrolysing)
MAIQVIIVVGARPNFMKAAPIYRALKSRGVCVRLVHTGQHYDRNMSDIFFHQLGLPEPDDHLGVGGGTHAVQTAKIMMEFERVINRERPQMVVVVGDVNSTIACSLVAVKAGIKVAHVEAGLRSFDRSMPEEINRVLTDRVSDLLFVTEESGVRNLEREGANPESVFFTGNVMIDSLVHVLKNGQLDLRSLEPTPVPGTYCVATMHRPSNVDDPEKLSRVVDLLVTIGAKLPLYLPLHPRTRNNLQRDGEFEKLQHAPGIVVLEPLGYLEFLGLMKDAAVVVTDSGGIQEETTYLRVPCLTVRDNTERPVTIEVGSNQLVPMSVDVIANRVQAILDGQVKQSQVPPLWDGHAADRIADILVEKLEHRQ